MSSAVPTPENLLAELRFAQSIARHLVTDQHLADEVAQEAILAAIQRPDVDGAGKRAWLSGVIRNLVNNRSREARRRREREARYAQDFIDLGVEPPESAAQEALMRGEQRATIASAVMALAEPYRTVIVLRYMEELAPPEIAKELSRPLETVKTQLRRGMSKLREDLDASNGGDGVSWALALLPLVAPTFPVLGVPTAGAPEGPSTGDASGHSSGSASGKPAALTGSSASAAAVGALPLWATIAAAAALLFGTVVLAPQWLSNQADSASPVVTDIGAVDASGDESGAPRKADALETVPAQRLGTSVPLTLPQAVSSRDVEGEPQVLSQEPSGKKIALRVAEAGTGRPVEGVRVRYVVVPTALFSDFMEGEGSDSEALMDPDPGFGVDAEAYDSAGVSQRLPHAAGSPFSFVEPMNRATIDFVAGQALASAGQEGSEGGAMDWPDDVGDEASTDSTGAADLTVPQGSELASLLDGVRLPEGVTLEGPEGAALEEGLAHVCLYLEATKGGFASLQTCVEVDLANPVIELELERPGHLTLERGDLDPRARVVVALSDMILNVRRADLLDAGESDLAVSDLPAGIYRLSARAYLPEFGSDPVFELEDILVRTEEAKPSSFALWRDNARDLKVRVEGASEAVEALRVRASGRYDNGRFRALVPVQEGQALLAGLGSQSLELELVTRGDVLAQAGLGEIDEAALSGPIATPRVHSFTLPTGSIVAVAKPGSLVDVQGTGDDVRYLVLPIGSDAASVASRRGSWPLRDLASGAEISNLPPGGFHLWWVAGNRVGRETFEVGAGSSTLAIDFRAPQSQEVTLRLCQCATPAISFDLLDEDGNRIPIDLFAFLPSPSESLGDEENPEPVAVTFSMEVEEQEERVFLPTGTYTARYRGFELTHATQAIEVGSGPASAVLHGAEVGPSVTLTFEGASSGEEVLISAAGTEADDRALTEGQASVAPGHLVALDDAKSAVLLLSPGRYLASNEAGRTATFEVSHESTRILLRWDVQPEEE